MQRITITIEDNLLAKIDAAAEARGYQNRVVMIPTGESKQAKPRETA
jgi:metal-responsive CopG/Arc/MetJ family transcriptional regulator